MGARAAIVLGMIATSGCEQMARAQNSASSASNPSNASRGSQTDGRSREALPFVEGETCTRTDDCPPSARCFDGRCQLTARSMAGEVHAERGERALARARYSDGAEAYRAAQEAYRTHEIPVPASVACGLARALVGLNDRVTAQDGRETMARALFECLQFAPPGSTMADQAIAGLAALSDRGLDVTALDRRGATLMTGRDPRPTVENTRVRVTFTGQGAGSRATFRDLINGEPIVREVTRCFLQWWETSHRNEDEGTVRVTYQRSSDDYDELGAARLTVTPVDIVPTSADAGTQVHWLQCTATAIQSAAATLHWPANADRWAESIVLSVRPGT